MNKKKIVAIKYVIFIVFSKWNERETFRDCRSIDIDNNQYENRHPTSNRFLGALTKYVLNEKRSLCYLIHNSRLRLIYTFGAFRVYTIPMKCKRGTDSEPDL